MNHPHPNLPPEGEGEFPVGEWKNTFPPSQGEG
jgi:hypothetical protein